MFRSRYKRKSLLKRLKAAQLHIAELECENEQLKYCLQISMIQAVDGNGWIAKPYPGVVDSVETHNARIGALLRKPSPAPTTQRL